MSDLFAKRIRSVVRKYTVRQSIRPSETNQIPDYTRTRSGPYRGLCIFLVNRIDCPPNFIFRDRKLFVAQKLYQDNGLKSKRYLSDRAHLKWHHNAERDNPSPKTNLVSRLNENFSIPDDAQRVQKWQRFERFQSRNSMVPSDVSLKFFWKNLFKSFIRSSF